ncbi:MAG TPA: hypothetical protein VF080_11810 [Solirubrobacteraceae bacterium]
MDGSKKCSALSSTATSIVSPSRTRVAGLKRPASYRFQAPDRQSYRTDLGETVTTIGEREWIAQPALGLMEQPYGEGLPFRTHEVFRWSPFARAITVRRRSPYGVDLALMDPAEPVWIDLHVRRADLRVTRVREISPGQFLTDRLQAFDRPLVIRPPGGTPRDR